jgi:hypothetical protein
MAQPLNHGKSARRLKEKGAQIVFFVVNHRG